MASIKVDLDTLDNVSYKMRSFLVNELDNANHLVDAIDKVPKAPSTGRVGAATHIGYIPAYRLFETKKYKEKDPSTGRAGAAAHCCICLNNIREGSVIVSMPICGHIYHKACLFNWVDLSKNTSCPYCRQDDF